MSHKKLSRRSFIRAAGGTIAFPYIISSSALGKSNLPAASERVTVGHIGVGSQGGGLLSAFLGTDTCQSIAVCDVYRDRRAQKKIVVDQRYADKTQLPDYKACTAYEDFRDLLARDDIDAVVIATPDHWHVPIAMAAVRAGKDVYVEKPLGMSINQNKAMRAAVHQYGRIFQYGTQQRSFSPHCRFACELVRNGYLGELKEIHVVAPGGISGGSTTPIPVPDGLNYDLWLGPAPKTPYTKDRCDAWKGTYYCYDNSLGFIGGWGAHPLDIMHWGYPHIPVEYEGTGIIPTTGIFTAITNWSIRGRFASGVAFTFKDGQPDSTRFVGTEGWVQVSRGSIQASSNELLNIKIKPNDIHLPRCSHYQNFIDCVKSRSMPVSDIDSAVQSDFIGHLSDIAMRCGRKITWDPVKETIVGDDAAQRMMDRPLRSPWTI